jgi:hypothetical protein
MKAAWAQVTSPVDKVKLWTSLAEFAYPKLGRTEHTGEGGAPIQVQIVTYRDPEAK